MTRYNNVTMASNPARSKQVIDASTTADIPALKPMKDSKQIYTNTTMMLNWYVSSTSKRPLYIHLYDDDTRESFISYRCWIDSSLQPTNDLSTFTCMTMTQKNLAFHIGVELIRVFSKQATSIHSPLWWWHMRILHFISYIGHLPLTATDYALYRVVTVRF